MRSVFCWILVFSCCAVGIVTGAPAAAEGVVSPSTVSLVDVPASPLSALDPSVAAVIEARRRQVESQVAEGVPADSEGRSMLSGMYGDLGFLYHAHELLDSAAACYANAETLMPSDPRWSYAGALAFKDSGDLDAAAAAYERNLDLLSANSAALIGLAEVRLEQNMPLVSKALLNHALSLSPESPAALALLGQVALGAKDYGRAAVYLERALAQIPAADRLHYPLALAYRGLGDMDKARHHMGLRGEVGVRSPDPIRDEIETRKTGERVLLIEGRRAFAAGRYSEAAALFQKALDADPGSTRARVNFGTALAAAGHRDEARATFVQVLEAEPENAAAAFNLADFLLEEGKSDEAIRWLEVAVKADASDAQARKVLADAYGRQGRFSDALEMVKEAVELRSSDQELWLSGAELERRLGHHGEARRWLEDGARLMPDQGLLLHALARLLATSPALEVRDGERAVELATQVAGSTGDLGHWHTVALALAEAGRCADAANVVSQILEKVDEESRAPLAAQLKAFQEGPPCRPPV